jgi:hypothetical protein
MNGNVLLTNLDEYPPSLWINLWKRGQFRGHVLGKINIS